jgi:ankyrin repeat protein
VGCAELVRAVKDSNATAVHWACQNGHLDVARLLVEAGGADLVRAGDDTNYTALHFACVSGHLEMARLLVEAGGAELVRAGDDTNYTALHLACVSGHLEMARLLVEAEGGLDSLKVKGQGNFTPIDVATQCEHADIAAMLKDAVCHMCGKASKFKCSKCKQYRYCGRDCQTAHWKKGHKKECKLLTSMRDKDVNPS